MDANNDVFETIMGGIERTNDIATFANNDLDFATNNIREALVKGKIALSEMLEIARESGHPRAFEVFTNLLATYASVNKDLIDVKRINSEIESNEGIGGDTINNNLILSTADLLKMIDNKREEQERQTPMPLPIPLKGNDTSGDPL